MRSLRQRSLHQPHQSPYLQLLQADFDQVGLFQVLQIRSRATAKLTESCLVLRQRSCAQRLRQVRAWGRRRLHRDRCSNDWRCVLSTALCERVGHKQNACIRIRFSSVGLPFVAAARAEAEESSPSGSRGAGAGAQNEVEIGLELAGPVGMIRRRQTSSRPCRRQRSRLSPPDPTGVGR